MSREIRYREHLMKLPTSASNGRILAIVAKPNSEHRSCICITIGKAYRVDAGGRRVLKVNTWPRRVVPVFTPSVGYSCQTTYDALHEDIPLRV